MTTTDEILAVLNSLSDDDERVKVASKLLPKMMQLCSKTMLDLVEISVDRCSLDVNMIQMCDINEKTSTVHAVLVVPYANLSERDRAFITTLLSCFHRSLDHVLRKSSNHIHNN